MVSAHATHIWLDTAWVELESPAVSWRNQSDGWPQWVLEVGPNLYVFHIQIQFSEIPMSEFNLWHRIRIRHAQIVLQGICFYNRNLCISYGTGAWMLEPYVISVWIWIFSKSHLCDQSIWARILNQHGPITPRVPTGFKLSISIWRWQNYP